MPATESRVDIPFLPEQAVVKRYDNGYQFVYVPKRGDVFNVSTWVKTGSIHEDDINNGVSHFLEHLMFKGSERFKPGEFDKAMEGMGAVINAATWKDFTFYYVTGPKGLTGENFDKALDMHADMLLCSTLPDAEIGEIHDPHDPNSTAKKRERGVVIEEIGMRSDQPFTKTFNALNHMMYGVGHPYQRDVIGSREIIASIPRDAIKDYYERWYSAPNMTTIVVGDFDVKELEAKVLKAFDFSHRPKASGQSIDSIDATWGKSSSERFTKLEGENQTTFFIMGFQGPRCQDLKEHIAVDLASRVLGEGRSSRLYQAFIERPKEPIFNSISCGQSLFKLGNVFYVQGNLNDDASNDEHVEKQLRAVESEIFAFTHKNPVTQDEFDRAKKKMKVEFAETSETASGIADAVGEWMTISGSLDGYIHYLSVLNELTRDDVIKAAQTWFDTESHYTAVLVPKG